MPAITLPFDFNLNVSVQAGDTAYYVPTTTTADFNVNSSAIVEIGLITVVDQINNTITCDTSLPTNSWPIEGDFILFSKDNKVNMASLLGYYAKVKIRNNSKTKAEMFQINADYFESSK